MLRVAGAVLADVSTLLSSEPSCDLEAPPSYELQVSNILVMAT